MKISVKRQKSYRAPSLSWCRTWRTTFIFGEM